MQTSHTYIYRNQTQVRESNNLQTVPQPDTGSINQQFADHILTFTMSKEFLTQILTLENSVTSDAGQACPICLEAYGSISSETGVIECGVGLPCSHVVGSAVSLPPPSCATLMLTLRFTVYRPVAECQQYLSIMPSRVLPTSAAALSGRRDHAGRRGRR